MNQMSVMGMMKAMVPITRFNKGEANKIFEEVESSGTKIVMKNNKPACILMSPEQYSALMEMLSDYILLEEAEKRTANMDERKLTKHEDVMKEFGISQSELDNIDVELE